MIIVMGWADGFGNDTVVYGVFESVEKAKEHFCEKDHVRYMDITLNEVTDVEYDSIESKPLYKHKKKKNRG